MLPLPKLKPAFKRTIWIPKAINQTQTRKVYRRQRSKPWELATDSLLCSFLPAWWRFKRKFWLRADRLSLTRANNQERYSLVAYPGIWIRTVRLNKPTRIPAVAPKSNAADPVFLTPLLAFSDAVQERGLV